MISFRVCLPFTRLYPKGKWWSLTLTLNWIDSFAKLIWVAVLADGLSKSYIHPTLLCTKFWLTCCRGDSCTNGFSWGGQPKGVPQSQEKPTTRVTFPHINDCLFMWMREHIKIRASSGITQPCWVLLLGRLLKVHRKIKIQSFMSWG